MNNPRVCILRTAGTNCDVETAFAFEQAGAVAEAVHINRFIQHFRVLDEFHILALPGGFSYGDDISAGRILANELKYKLAAQLRKFIADGKLIIGICNGFQALVKAGLLPGNTSLQQEAALVINDCGLFRDEWVYLKTAQSQGATKCVWTQDLPGVISLPIAHGEGKFVTGPAVLNRLKKKGRLSCSIAMRQAHLQATLITPTARKKISPAFVMKPATSWD